MSVTIFRLGDIVQPKGLGTSPPVLLEVIQTLIHMDRSQTVTARYINRGDTEKFSAERLELVVPSPSRKDGALPKQGDLLAVGDVVMLKSGGPKMTISKVYGDAVRCRWATEYGVFVEEYHTALLMRA